MSNWTTVISAESKWYDFNLRELVQYRDLIFMFVKRSFTAQYKQTILGPLWFILNPLLTSFISTVVFGGIAGIESEGVPYFLFYLCGYTLWNYFATCVNQTSVTFTANAGILGKVYFPRLVMPISTVIYSAINMIVIFVMTVITMTVCAGRGVELHPNICIILIPALVLQTAALSLGVGIIVSSLTTKYRDLAVLVTFGVNLWMYATPVVYPLSRVSGKLRICVLLNPMTAIITNFRYALLGVGSFETLWWGISILITLIVLVVGVLLFNKVEKTFMDTV